MKAYTGVGSRSTPQDIMKMMSALASKLEVEGWVLRSGAADGADTGFENGVGIGYTKQYPVLQSSYPRTLGTH